MKHGALLTSAVTVRSSSMPVLVCATCSISIHVQDGYIGFNTGNGKKLSYSQAELGQGNYLVIANFFYISSVESNVATLSPLL